MGGGLTILPSLSADGLSSDLLLRSSQDRLNLLVLSSWRAGYYDQAVQAALSVPDLMHLQRSNNGLNALQVLFVTVLDGFHI